MDKYTRRKYSFYEYVVIYKEHFKRVKSWIPFIFRKRFKGKSLEM